MKKKIALLVLSTIPFALSAKEYKLTSPDGKLKTVVNVEKDITYQISHESDEVLSPSPIALYLKDGKVLGENPKVKSVKETV